MKQEKTDVKKQKRRVIIGNAWPYANNLMHVGHLCALLPGDIIARYYRLSGDEVMLVSGSDCHGTPITERARKEKVSPREIAETYHKTFVRDLGAVNFSYDKYGATFDDYHKAEIQKIFLKMYDAGEFFKKTDTQDFCESCNMFLSDREIRGTCPHCGSISKGDQCDNCLTSMDASQLKEKTCGICGGKTQQRQNKSLMFKLSGYQKDIECLLDKNRDHWRVNAVNETQKYLSQGLLDRAVTRDLNWGIDVPVEEFKDKKIYVWIEAVLGYYTMSKFLLDQRGIKVEDYYKASDDLRMYLAHGKDNIPFHTVIYPALLLAVDKNCQLPTHIVSCEYIKVGAEKMSKSLGNLLTVYELTEKFDPDTIRFYAILSNPEKKDSGFTTTEMINTHNKLLVGGLGNFVNRNLSYLVKKFEGKVSGGAVDKDIIEKTRSLYKSAGEIIEAGNTREALEHIVEYIQLANKYYDDNKPWVKVHEDAAAFGDITRTCIYMMANMSNLFHPFIPAAMDRLKAMLKLGAAKWEEVDCDITQLENINILFNRIEEEK